MQDRNRTTPPFQPVSFDISSSPAKSSQGSLSPLLRKGFRIIRTKISCIGKAETEQGPNRLNRNTKGISSKVAKEFCCLFVIAELPPPANLFWSYVKTHDMVLQKDLERFDTEIAIANHGVVLMPFF